MIGLRFLTVLTLSLSIFLIDGAESWAQIDLTLYCAGEEEPEFVGLASTADGELYIGVTDQAIYVWSSEHGQLQQTFSYQAGSAAFNSKDDELLLRVEYVEEDNDQLDIYSLSEKKLRKIKISSKFTPLEFSQDGARVLCLHNDDWLQVFEYPSAKPLLKEKMVAGGISAATISADGHRVAYGQRDGDGQRVQVLDIEREVTVSDSANLVSSLRSLAFSPQGDVLAVNGTVFAKDGVFLFDVDRMRPQRGVYFPTWSYGVAAWFDDGQRLAVANDSVCRIYNVESQEVLTTLRGRTMRHLHVPNGAKHLISACDETDSLAWDWRANLNTREPARTMTTHDPISDKDRDGELALAWHPDGTTLAISIPRQRSKQTRSDPVSPIARSVVGSTRDSMWDGKQIRLPKRNGENISRQRLPGFAEILILNAKSGKSIALLSAQELGDPEQLGKIQFSRSGNTLGCTYGAGNFALWNWQQQKVVLKHDVENDEQWTACQDFDFLPDGSSIVAVGDYGAQIRDLAKNRPVKLFSSIAGRNVAVIDDRDFAAGLAVWDISTGDQIAQGDASPKGFTIKPVSAQVFIARSPSYHGIGRWNVDTGEFVYPYTHHSKNSEAEIHDFSVSTDGQFLAVACQDGLIRLWDVATGRLLTNLKGHQGPVHAIAFTPNSRLLASTSRAGQTMLWDLRDFADGRRKKVNIKQTLPTRHVIRTTNGGSVTIAFNRTVTNEEVVEALAEAKQQISESK